MIDATFEIVPTMAGRVKYYTRDCPHGEKWMGSVIKVGSNYCRMCRWFGSSQVFRIEMEEDDFVEGVECNKE